MMPPAINGGLGDSSKSSKISKDQHLLCNVQFLQEEELSQWNRAWKRKDLFVSGNSQNEPQRKVDLSLNEVFGSLW